MCSDDALLFVLQLGVTLMSAWLGGLLFAKWKLPVPLGACVAGILAGPFVLGGLPIPGFPEGLLASFTKGTMFQATVLFCAIPYLFAMGMETDLGVFRTPCRGALAGLCGGLVAALAGAGVVWWLSPATPTAATLVLTASVAAAGGMGLASRVLADRNQLAAASGRRVFAGTLALDLLVVVLLTVGVHCASGNSWTSFATGFAAALGCFLLVRKVDRRLARRGSAAQCLVFALGLLFLLTGVFRLLSLPSCAGAYLLGLAYARSEAKERLARLLRVPLSVCLLMLASLLGMAVDPAALQLPAVVFAALFFVLATAAAKVAGTLAVLRLGKTPLPDAALTGFALTGKGGLALLAAGTAFLCDAVPRPVYSAGVAWLVLFAAAVSLLLRKWVRPSPESRVLSFHFPNAGVAGALAYSLRVGLRHEGFFTATLDNDRNLCLARKDGLAVRLLHRGEELQIAIPEDARPVLDLMVDESVLALEQALDELHKPFRRDGGGHAGAAERVAPHRKILLDVLSPDTMIPHLRGKTREACIRELLMILVEQGAIHSISGTYAQILQREAAMSTAVHSGIACPHARTTEVERLVCAVGLAPDGVAFGAPDGTPSRVIVLTLSPADAPTPYLEFISAVSGVLQDEANVATLEKCQTSGEMFAVLTADRGAEV